MTREQAKNKRRTAQKAAAKPPRTILNTLLAFALACMGLTAVSAGPSVAEAAEPEVVLAVEVTEDGTLEAPIEEALKAPGAPAFDSVTTLQVSGVQGYAVRPKASDPGGKGAYLQLMLPGIKTLDLRGFAGTFENAAFRECTAITAVRFPAGAELKEQLFYGCNRLASFSVGDAELQPGVVDLRDITAIGSAAFAYCGSIEAVRMPRIDSLPREMLAQCHKIDAIGFYQGTAPTADAGAFQWDNHSGTMYYPTGAVGFEEFRIANLPSNWTAAPTAYTAPSATSSPEGASIKHGDDAVFTVEAAGDPAPIYRWQESADGANWNYLSNGGMYRRTNTKELTLLDVPATYDGYQYRCILSNFVAKDIASDAAPLAVQQTAPGQPTALTCTPGDGMLDLSWQAPASDGGSPITGYEVRLDAGTWTDVGGKLAHSFTGLSNGQAYQCAVRAVNGMGEGAEASVSGTPFKESALTVTAGEGGKTTGSQSGTYLEKSAVSVTAVPGPGYVFSHWEASGIALPVPNMNPAAFSMPGNDVALKAHFIRGAYTISAKAGEGGAISPVGEQAALRGQDIKFTATPFPGYAIRDVLVDGKSVGKQSSYTFTDIGASHTIEARFVKTASAPTRLAVASGNRQLTITWAPPADVGTAGISSYEVSIDGGTWVRVPKALPSHTFKNLENGRRYTLSVRAVTVLGPGASAPADGTPTVVKGMFKDVDADLAANGGHVWYIDDGWLDYVVGKGIMKGYTDGSRNFGIYDPVTRGHVATVLYRADNPGSDATVNPAHYGQKSSFTDVEGGQYYTAAIEWAKQQGIVTGYASTDYTTYGPEDPITREQAATMMARFAELHGQKIDGADPAVFSSLVGHTDVSPWAKEAVIWCCAKGIIGGIAVEAGAPYLAPQDYAWRVSMAKIVTVTLRDVLGR